MIKAVALAYAAVARRGSLPLSTCFFRSSGSDVLALCKIVQTSLLTYTRVHRTSGFDMRRLFNQIARCIGLCMLLLVGLSPSAAQKTLGLPGPADADPLDAFGSKPNVTICPSNKPFQCEAGNCVTNPTKCEPVDRKSTRLNSSH